MPVTANFFAGAVRLLAERFPNRVMDPETLSMFMDLLGRAEQLYESAPEGTTILRPTEKKSSPHCVEG